MDISNLRERTARTTFTVTELNAYIKQRIDTDTVLSAITVCGEISNFTDHRSGHLYFTLKDSDSQIKAVMFKWQRAHLKFLPHDGDRVIICGSLSVYTQGGSIQIYVNQITPDGIGELYKAYEQLKEKLADEGLFDESHKRLIPKFPSSIGVITSPTGAAIRDIINVTGRRYPLAKIYLYPTLVQGDGAEASLIEALDYFDKSKLVDLIIIGRGGGSIEDLWAFNGERLARRIFALKTPIISAVGHETDFTICDFVADKRAPTPSAAAELAVPDIRELYAAIEDFEFRTKNALLNNVARKRERFELLSTEKISSTMLRNILQLREKVKLSSENAKNACKTKRERTHFSLSLLIARTNALSPLATLSRGYSIVEKNGSVVTSVSQILNGDSLQLRFYDGSVDVVADGIEQRSTNEKNNEL